MFLYIRRLFSRIIKTCFCFSLCYFIQPAHSQNIDKASMAVNGEIEAFAIYEKKLFVAGHFDSIVGSKVNNIAAYNGSTWSDVGGGVDGTISNEIVYNNELFIVGSFTTAGGKKAHHIAKWNGKEWSPLGKGVNGFIYSLCGFNGELYAVGGFDSAGGRSVNQIAKWNGKNWSDVGDGLNGELRVITTYRNTLFVGGELINPLTHQKDYCIAKWDGKNWSMIHNIIGMVLSLVEYNGLLIAGGALGDSNRNQCTIVSWNGSKWNYITSHLKIAFDRISTQAN